MQNGRYEILETIGSGTTGRVDRARDTVIGRTVALKTFLRGKGNGTAYEQLLREAQIVGQLNHPSIVGLYDVGLDENGVAYLVMEYVPGSTLETLLLNGPIPFRKACAWGADLASALARAHAAGIIHGDVKPANILVTEEGRVKLSDFGISRFSTRVSGSGSLRGTPAYISPEQIEGKPQDCRSDLFSLGIVIYEMVTGKRPFEGTSIGAVCGQILYADPPPPSSVNPATSPALDRIMALCLAKDPAGRYANGDDLARDLYPLARRNAQPVVRPEPRPWLFRPMAPLPRSVVWATAALAVVAIAAAASVRLVRAVQARLSVPPLPPSVAISLAPKAPETLLSFSAQPQIQDSQSVPSATHSAAQTGSAKSEPKSSRHPAASAHLRSAPAQAASLAANLPQHNLPMHGARMASPGSSVIAPRRGQLEVEILAQVADATLAVYADRELLFTKSSGAADQNKPLHLQYALPLGLRQLRVALYGPDKSLQTEKEGLVEIRAGASNKLAIRVVRHSKFLRKRDTALEVIWPAAAPAYSVKSAPAGITPAHFAAAATQLRR